jgi:hypothetical protein
MKNPTMQTQFYPNWMIRESGDRRRMIDFPAQTERFSSLPPMTRSA